MEREFDEKKRTVDSALERESDEKKRTVDCEWIATGIFLGLILFIWFILLLTMSPDAPKTGDEGMQICFLGDSNLGLFRDETGVTSLVGQKLGAAVYNCGVGGAAMALRNTEFYDDDYFEAYSFTNVVKAITSHDFSPMHDNPEAVYEVCDYAGESLKVMEGTDFNKMDCFVISYGLNDYCSAVPLESDDPYDRYTYAGALRTGIETIQKAYPDAVIILNSITYCWFWNEGQQFISGYDKDFGGGTIEAYRDCMQNVANEYGITFIDNLQNLEIDEGNYKEYLLEEMHLNEDGREKMASSIADTIRFEKELQ